MTFGISRRNRRYGKKVNLRTVFLVLSAVSSLSFYFVYVWVARSSAVAYVAGRKYSLSPAKVYSLNDETLPERNSEDHSLKDRLLYYRVILPPHVLCFSMLPVYVVTLSLFLLTFLYVPSSRRTSSSERSESSAFDAGAARLKVSSVGNHHERRSDSPADAGDVYYPHSRLEDVVEKPVEDFSGIPGDESPVSAFVGSGRIHPLMKAMFDFCDRMKLKETYFYVFFPLKKNVLRGGTISENSRRADKKSSSWRVSSWGYIFKVRCRRSLFSRKIRGFNVKVKPLSRRDFEEEPLSLLKKNFFKSSKALRKGKFYFVVIATPTSGPVGAILFRHRKMNSSSKKLKVLKAFLKKYKSFLVKVKHRQLVSPYQDGLTGLTRRDYAETEAETWTSVGVAIFDIDDFKKINDTYGHSTGDAVLRFAGRLLKRTFSRIKKAIPFRYGGEELAVFFKPEYFREAVSLSESFRKSMEKSSKSFGFKVTVSGGVAVGKSIGEAYRKADSLLYLSKRSGKNRINWRSL